MVLADRAATLALPGPQPRDNFAARYWRGEVALGPSYWLVYVLLSIVVGRGLAALQSRVLAGTSYDPKLLFALTAGGLLATVPLSVWQFVGLWRAAGKRRAARRDQGKRAILTWLVQANVVLGILVLGSALGLSTAPALLEVYRMAFLGDPEIPSYGFRTMRGGTEAEIVGGFKYGLARDFTALMDANPDLRVVHLDSVGGRVGEARHLYRAIKARGLQTYVAAGCYSACTMAFAAGSRRWVGPHAVLGFHAPAFPGVQIGKTAGMASYEAKVFAAAGFAPDFIAKAVGTLPPALWKPSLAQMEAARVVTDVASPDTFADSGAGLDLRPAKWEAKVKKALPELSVLAQSRPDLFEPISDRALAAYKAGDSAQAVGRILTGGLRDAFHVMLPTADDDTLIAYARLVVDESAALRAKSAEDCYLYLSGRPAGRDFSAELGPLLVAREAALRSRVIATRSPRVTLSEPEQQAVRIRFTRKLAAAATPADLRALARPQTRQAGQAAYCRAMIATFKTGAAMDPPSAGAMLSRLVAR